MTDPDTDPAPLRRSRWLRSLIWWIEYDRSGAAAVARENYLRRLMGLSEKVPHRKAGREASQ